MVGVFYKYYRCSAPLFYPDLHARMEKRRSRGNIYRKLGNQQNQQVQRTGDLELPKNITGGYAPVVVSCILRPFAHQGQIKPLT